MSQSDTPNCSEREVDIRQISANTAERLTLQAYETLRVNESLILLNDDDPHQLYETLEGEFAGSFSWETLTTDQGEYRIRMTKRATTAMPRIVADTTEIVATAGTATGSVWQLAPGARDLDSNIIVLPPHDEIGQHVGPDLDVLILVLQGSGELETELDTISLESGSLVWLPRKSQRRFIAGPDGLQYFTVHQRKPALGITTGPTGA